MGACSRDRLWFYYVIASLITFFGGLILIIPARIIWYSCYAYKEAKDQARYQHARRSGARGCFARIRAKLVELNQGHNGLSRAIVIIFWLINMASVVLYLVEATMYTIDDCGPFFGDPAQYTWLAFACVFSLQYILRVMAAPDKLTVWLDIYSLVDHFTVPQIFMGVYLGRNWIGFKFLRMLYLLQAPEILEMLSVIKTRQNIRLVQVGSIFLSCWFVSSGFVFLSENNGDPFHNYQNGQKLTYWSCVYWLLVTMSTVGFGEISPSTDISRAFIVLFIIGSFAMFTSIIPELARSLGRSSKYTKPYRRVYGKKHIVVCGNITSDNVCSFIKNFVHEDADTKNIDVVFLSSSKPNLELEAFFKRHFSDVSFIQGSVMDLHSCQMVKLKDADCCLIMTDRRAEDPDKEDAMNIMRVTAVKNFHPEAKIIIQILQQRNKSYLLQIPSWSWQNGDDVICISELKLGIMGQNCMAPGFSALMSNLFTNRSFNTVPSSEWERNYRYGCGHEIYVEPISSAFTDMTFQQVAEICFAEMNVLLLGIAMASGRKKQLLLNPGNQYVLQSDMLAYMFAQSPDDARKVFTYKSKRQSKKEEALDCKVSMNNNSGVTVSDTAIKPLEDSGDEIEYLQGIGYRLANYGERSPVPGDENSMVDAEKFDFAGLYHWCKKRTLEEATLDYSTEHNFQQHVVLCMNGEADTPVKGLLNFVMPLRSSNLRKEELKDIIIIGKTDYMVKEWSPLANFPRIWFLRGSGTSRSHLRLVNVQQSCMCVILSPNQSVEVDGHYVDKDAVLTTLNVRYMSTENLEEKIRGLGTLTNPEEFRKLTGVYGEIPYITELENDADVTYLEQDDDDDPNTPLYLTVPYITGRTFADSVLDSLASCIYLSRDVLTLTRALISAVESTELELILAEGLGFAHKDQPNTATPTRRNRCHLTQYPLCNGPLEKLKHGECYGELFMQSLRQYGFLCMGLYRLLEPEEKDPRRRKRYVITHPPFHFKLLTSDKVYVLKPFNFSGTSSEPAGDPTTSNATGPRSRNGSKRSLQSNVSATYL